MLAMYCHYFSTLVYTACGIIRYSSLISMAGNVMAQILMYCWSLVLMARQVLYPGGNTPTTTIKISLTTPEKSWGMTD